MEQESSIYDERITTFGRLVEAHAKLSDELGKELEAAIGIPLLWYGVLLLLGRSPQGVRPIGELINATAFTSGGVTRLVDRMAAAGYVERRPCRSDRRVQYVALTDHGRQVLDRATPIHIQGIQEHLIDALQPEEVAILNTALAKVVARDTDGSDSSSGVVCPIGSSFDLPETTSPDNYLNARDM